MMKKLFSLLLFTHFCLLIFAQQTINQHIITQLPYSPCVGNPVLFNAYDTSGVYGWASHEWAFGDSTFTNSYASCPAITHVYQSVGLREVYLIVRDSLTTAWDSSGPIHVPIDVACGGPQDLVFGTVFLDQNSNGYREPSEQGLPNVAVRVDPGNYITTTNHVGDFALYLGGGTFQITVAPPPNHYNTFPASGLQSVTLSGVGAASGMHMFGILPLANQPDLSVAVTAGLPPVRNNIMPVALMYRNIGSDSLDSSLEFEFDAQMVFDSASHGGTANGNVITWDLDTLAPGAFGIVRAYLDVPQALALGTALQSIATIFPTTGDQDTTNNRDTLNQQVVGSYDPNDKQVFPAGWDSLGSVLPGTELRYKIRFQNTGTWFALDVVIEDTLDHGLDLTTLEIIGGSHPFTWRLDQNRLRFEFADIMLPDSNMNEPASHGWVEYRVQHLQSLPLGTSIINTAFIYFDANPPIVTNTTLTTLAIPTAVELPLAEGEVQIVPQPLHDLGHIRFENPLALPHTLHIYDLSGKEVAVQQGIRGDGDLLYRRHLPDGLYFFALRRDGRIRGKGKLLLQ